MISTMRALEYRLSIPRYLCAKMCAKVFPHRYMASVSPLRLRNVAPPALPGPEWVRIRVEMCGICGSDLNALRGNESYSMEPYASFPAVMGHEIIGRVVELGANAQRAFTDFQNASSGAHSDGIRICEGTRVAVENILPCAPRGISPPCAACARGDYALCENYVSGHIAPGVCIGFTKDLGGGFGEYLVAHVSQLFPIPDNVPLEHAVLVDSLASALQPIADHLPTNDQRVLVIGSGIIGLHAIQNLRMAGFTGALYAVARHSFQAEWAKQLGASEIIRGNIFQSIADLTGARLHKPTLGPPVLDGGVDLVFDCVGSSSTIDASLRVTRKRGTIILVGTAGNISNVDVSPLWFKEIRLTGSAMFSHSVIHGQHARTYQHVIDALSTGRLTAAGLLTHQFPLEQYRTAFSTALDKHTHNSLKVAFTHI